MSARARKQAGFTLVELMIAMVAGAFAVSGVYYLNSISLRTFSEQTRVSETQMGLRSAMEQLRREFSRAGYLYTSSTRTNPDCGGNVPPTTLSEVSPRELRAISVVSNKSASGASTLLGPVATNSWRADQVDVWGNFATSDAYLADPTTTTSSVLTFQTNRESFLRSFADASGTLVPARFNEAFVADRMVRVEQEGRVFFRDIASVTGYTVTLDSPLPGCFEPTHWAAITPIVHYRYQLEPETASELGRLRPITPALGSSRSLLVRRELRRTSETPIAGTSRVVLDYAVEFGIDVIRDDAAVPGANPPAAPVWRLERSMTDAFASPWQLRALVVTLSSRSAEADPRLPRVERVLGAGTTLDGPMMTFCVWRCDKPKDATERPLNARVRTLRSEIFLQNL